MEIDKITLTPVDTDEYKKSNTITDCILYTNKTVQSLDVLKPAAIAGSETYTLKDDLLLY